MSLREVVWAILRDDQTAIKKVAADPKTRQVITAYMVCRGGPFVDFDTKDKKKLVWLEAVEAADIKDMDSADRLAWAAYTLGQPKIAQRWADRAKADSPITQWVQAKLLLRAGKIDEAAALLAKASKGFPKDQRWAFPRFDEGEWNEKENLTPTEVVAGELAVLGLARRQYVDSLDLLLRNNWWTDAAYVAERVLTVDELQKYVDANWSAQLAASFKPGEGASQGGLVNPLATRPEAGSTESPRRRPNLFPVRHAKDLRPICESRDGRQQSKAARRQAGCRAVDAGKAGSRKRHGIDGHRTGPG
jgi:hypothetical protein